MSSSEVSRRQIVRWTIGLALFGSLSACFRPLYGPTASGIPLQDALAAVDVAMPESSTGQERLGHYVRSELIFDLDGSGEKHEKHYKLSISTSETVQGTTVDILTGRANAAILNGATTYSLTNLDGTKTLLTGTARANATYYRDEQRFANVRAARDADIRVSKLMADDIKQRLAAFFATAS